MENNFKPNCKIVTRFDLGWTEDEYNNFMIDCFQLMNKEQDLPEENAVPAIVGNSVTITITKKDHYNPYK